VRKSGDPRRLVARRLHAAPHALCERQRRAEGWDEHAVPGGAGWRRALGGGGGAV